MTDFTIAVPVIIALVQAVKLTKVLPDNWAPLISIIFGMLWYYFSVPGDAGEVLITGLIAGLTASGLYSGVKAQMK